MGNDKSKDQTDESTDSTEKLKDIEKWHDSAEESYQPTRDELDDNDPPSEDSESESGSE